MTDQADKISSFFEVFCNKRLDPLFWRAELTSPLSTWCGHIPFAHWVVQAAQPGTLVELGTHTGVSYSAFCLAVERSNFNTRCWSVDTWKNDGQTGDRDKTYLDLLNYHKQKFGAFSTLLRCTFDDALSYFADGSIDLLHIDGSHTYEAVKHDFETWLPKLSKRAIVLFHDTNVYKQDYGVWRFWAELRDRYPSFEFLHGSGLGVLAVGSEIPENVSSLFKGLSERDITTTRERFEFLGERWEAEQIERMHRNDIEQLNAEQARKIEELSAHIEGQDSRIDSLNSHINKLTSRIGILDAQSSMLNEKAKVSAAEMDSATASIRQYDSHLAAEREQKRRIEEELAHVRRELEDELVIYKTRLHTSRNSLSWRMTTPVRWIGRQPKRIKSTTREASRLLTDVIKRKNNHSQPRESQGAGQVSAQREASAPSDSSDDHLENLAREIFAQQQAELSLQTAVKAEAKFTLRPLVSVIMPVYNAPLEWLRRAVESLQQQYYDHWELCVVDDCSETDEQRNLLKQLAASDPRIRLKVTESHGGTAAASNVALEMARGKYIALFDHDDELTPDALFRMVEAINQKPEADFIYSDECKVDDTAAHKLFGFILKPDWSPEIMFNGMITGHLSVYKKALVEQIGGFRTGYDASRDYDLALRASEVATCIVHVERILYLCRVTPGSAALDGKDKSHVRESNIAALNDALQRRSIPGEAVMLPHASYVRVAIPEEESRVSIIIPSDSMKNLRLALQAIRLGTDYKNYEVVVVCNTPLADRLKDIFFDWENLVFVGYDKPYNFSDKCNEGARAASGDIVVFYNDDVFPIEPDWIERLIEYLWVPGVGGVSPKLLHEDNTIQYAGMITGAPGLFGTAYYKLPHDSSDAFLSMHNYVRNVSILSGACCAIRKDLFLAVNGFDAVNTPDGHSDVDLSFKLIEAGYRCVYTPHALLHHIGNHSWGAKPYKYKADIFALRRWGAYVSQDPYFTETMKRVLYNEFRFQHRIYAEHIDPNQPLSGANVLFVSHELTLTGAPRMLFYGAQTVLQAGGFPVIISREDGPMREEMIRAGITVIIDTSICDNHWHFGNFARNFDLAVVNTVVLDKVVRQLSKIDILRTIWWLHEGHAFSHEFNNHMEDIDWERVQLLCVSHYARSFVRPDLNVEFLHNGIPDQADSVMKEGKPKNGLLTFVTSGTVEPRKGQDLLVDAVSLLPEHVRQQCRFVLTGKLWPDFWANLQKRIGNLPVEYLGLLEHQAQLELVASCDVLVCPSRDDPFALVVMEGAMLSKPIILSTHVGACEVFDDKSSYVFESNNAASLAHRLLEAYEHRASLQEMGKAARHTFECELSLDVFKKHFLDIISQQMALQSQEKPVKIAK